MSAWPQGEVHRDLDENPWTSTGSVRPGPSGYRLAVIELAASYGLRLARNHPFVDGNKRVAFQPMYVFLGLNGLRIDAAEPEVVRVILALAAGDLSEPDLVEWLRQHTASR